MSNENTQAMPNEISTARLKLRPFRFSDVPAMHAYLQEPDMGTYLEGADNLPSQSVIESIIARHILADTSQRSVWAITINDVVVGGASINFEKAHRIAEIGYSISKPLWGQGYASEAAAGIIDAAFGRHPQLQRIQASIHPENTGSIRVAERIGMSLEGILRSNAFVGGDVADEAVYAIVRDTWSKRT